MSVQDRPHDNTRQQEKTKQNENIRQHDNTRPHENTKQHENTGQHCEQHPDDPNCVVRAHICEAGSSDPACINNVNQNNLVDCNENPRDPGCFVAEDQEERENLCERNPINPICQTLNIVQGSHSVWQQGGAPDPICRLSIAKQTDPTGKLCKPGSSDPRCAKKQNTKPFVNVGDPLQLPKIKQQKKERDPKVFFEIPPKKDKPAKNKPKRLRNPLKSEKSFKIPSPKFKPFTAFRKPVDPNKSTGDTKHINKDHSKAVGPQVQAKVPENNKASFKTPPVVRLKTRKNQGAKTRSKDP